MAYLRLLHRALPRLILVSSAGLALPGAFALAWASPNAILLPAQRQAVLEFTQESAARQVSATPSVTRVAIQVGEPDSRLRLAPCRRVEPHWPAGASPWGRTRVGLRCVDGDSPWNIFVPVTVQVFGPAVIAANPVAAGSTLQASDLRMADIDLAADRSPAVRDLQSVIGRDVQRAMAAGESLREQTLKVRQWFAAGDTVRLVARGDGFAIVSSGQALNAGVEGQATRVRTDNGRILTGTASGERLVELTL